jgi:hypothetical protein
MKLSKQSTEPHKDVHAILALTSAIAKNLIALKRPDQALALMQQKQKAFPAYDDYTRLAVATTFTACYLATKHYRLADT